MNISKKTLLLPLLMVALCFAKKADAQPTFVSPQACIPANPALPAGGTVYNLSSNGTTISSITSLGDIEIVSITPALPTTSNITITVRSRNVGRDTINDCISYLNSVTKKFGFGKAALRVNFVSGACGGSIQVDIFKTFSETPPIIGPKCVAIGDTVTFSVCSILSVNQNANIGIDKYTWGTDNVSIPGLQRVYKSGDSSSVTYRVVSGWAGGTLSCRFGQCNSSTLSTLTLGVRTLPPTAVTINGTTVSNNGSICISTATTPVTLTATPPAGLGYTYRWSTNNGSWGFGTSAAATSIGNSVSLNINESQGIVYLTTLGGCSPRTDTFNINRSLAAPLFIRKSDTASCLTSGSSVLFTVNNPANTANVGNIIYNWSIPTGWATDSSKGPTKAVTVGTNGGTITVTAAGCTGSLSIAVSVKPAKPVAITGSICVPSGTVTTQNYSIPAVPGATSYTWSNTAGWTGSSTTNTISYTSNGTTTGIISVRANNGSCAGDTVQRVISFSPRIADSIRVTGCWNIGIPGVVSFAVNTPQTGVIYTWSVNGGGTLATTTGNSVNFNTNGIAGTYTISVITSNTSCGASPTRTRTITVAPNGVIGFAASVPTPPLFIIGDYLFVTGATSTSKYRWYNCATLAPLTVPSGGYTSFYLFANAATKGTRYCVEVRDTLTGCITVLSDTTRNYGARVAPGDNALPPAPDKITISPNPTDNAFVLQLPVTKNRFIVSVYNNKGAFIHGQNCTGGSNRFNTATWPNGEYILNITNSNGENTTRRVVVKR
jgi:PKD-like domain/Secretion system C-terminal sorting domain